MLFDLEDGPDAVTDPFTAGAARDFRAELAQLNLIRIRLDCKAVAKDPCGEIELCVGQLRELRQFFEQPGERPLMHALCERDHIGERRRFLTAADERRVEFVH